jgi:hypothetical protein
MARHYVLSADDLALIRTKRRVSNRLGFAVQLVCFAILAVRWIPPRCRAPMRTFVASPIGADPKLFGDYAHRAEICREHLLELQQCLRLRSLRLADWRACSQVGVNAA